MSASENGESALQRVQNTRFSGSNDGISSRDRPKSHYPKIRGLLLDFGAS
jgi:hypothetical protein